MNNIFTYDAKEEREARRKINYYLAQDVIMGNKPVKVSGKVNINDKALDRVCENLELTKDQLFEKAKNDNYFLRSLAMNIAVDASRQGSLDEKAIFYGISYHMRPYGHQIFDLPKNGKGSIRPNKDGGVIYDLPARGSGKCLKSIDAIIDGIVSGYIFAKVTIGKGGHQHNVEDEALYFINWAKSEPKDKIYVLLLDGNSIDKYLEYTKDSENIWVVDHISFQEKLISLSQEISNV